MRAFNMSSSRRLVLKTGLGLAVFATGIGSWFELQRGSTSAAKPPKPTPPPGTVTPFALTSGSQFRPTTGPALDYSNPNGTYKSQVNTILQYSAQLNDTTKTIADYWANGPHSETPPGHWELFTQFVSAQYISAKDKHALADDVMLFFALSNAVFDAGIAPVWRHPLQPGRSGWAYARQTGCHPDRDKGIDVPEWNEILIRS